QPNHILGDQDANVLSGTNGADNIHGKNGSDYVSGGNGADFIFGGGQNDLLFGGNGNDWIEGGFGADALFGEIGQDTLVSTGGRDNMQGGGGADTFMFIGATTGAQIFDWQDGLDHIDFTRMEAVQAISDLRISALSDQSFKIEFTNDKGVASDIEVIGTGDFTLTQDDFSF
ncbi:MAG: calcium-binding protein, partial [Roseobacter sp.]